jgi:hydrogenase maturation protease
VGFDFDVERGAAPIVVRVAGVDVRRGSRVRLHPHPGADAFDLALAGRIGTVAGIEQDFEEKLHLAVTLEDDPGADLGEARQPGHRFFFAPDEVEPLDRDDTVAAPRVLVAGIGNVFLADDGFGVVVVQALLTQARRAGVHIVDFGIRGLDLAYALQDGWDAVIFVDAAPRGLAPGTLSVIEPAVDAEPASPSAHAMDPVSVLRLARTLGHVPACVRIVACEPQILVPPDDPEMVMELSPPVRAAVDGAVRLVQQVIDEIVSEEEIS